VRRGFCKLLVTEDQMSGRKIVDERDARSSLAAARRSGLSLGAWGRSHGIDGRSLRAWSINLARGAMASSAPRRTRQQDCSPRLVELVPAPTPSPQPRFVVRVGVFAVEVAGGFDDAELRRLLAVLAAC
jgi:hypothetical protein